MVKNGKVLTLDSSLQIEEIQNSPSQLPILQSGNGSEQSAESKHPLGVRTEIRKKYQ